MQCRPPKDRGAGDREWTVIAVTDRGGEGRCEKSEQHRRKHARCACVRQAQALALRVRRDFRTCMVEAARTHSGADIYLTRPASIREEAGRPRLLPNLMVSYLLTYLQPDGWARRPYEAAVISLLGGLACPAGRPKTSARRNVRRRIGERSLQQRERQRHERSVHPC